MSRSIKILSIGKEKEPNKLPLFVRREIDSLCQLNTSLVIVGYGLVGKGILGYIKAFFQLKSIVKKEKPDIIHAHYSLSGVVALLSCRKCKTIVTFLGSDVFFRLIPIRLSRYFVEKKADHIILVSKRMNKFFKKHQKITVIPQGIDIKSFVPSDNKVAKEKLGWQTDKINILFPSSSKRFEKNFDLARSSVASLPSTCEVQLWTLENIDPKEIPIYLNAADIILITSKWEGSSNITKEAMACNSIIVSTDVGDARTLFYGVKGYYLSQQNKESVVKKLEAAIHFLKSNEYVRGRDRIIDLGLDDISIAERIKKVYESILE